MARPVTRDGSQQWNCLSVGLASRAEEIVQKPGLEYALSQGQAKLALDRYICSRLQPASVFSDYAKHRWQRTDGSGRRASYRACRLKLNGDTTDFW